MLQALFKEKEDSSFIIMLQAFIIGLRVLFKAEETIIIIYYVKSVYS